MEATALELGRSGGGTGWWLCGSIHGCSSTTHGRLLTSQSVSQPVVQYCRLCFYYLCVEKALLIVHRYTADKVACRPKDGHQCKMHYQYYYYCCSMPLNERTGQLDKVHLLCSIDIAMVHSQWKVGSIKSSTQEMVNPEFLFGTSTLPAHPDDNYGPINWHRNE